MIVREQLAAQQNDEPGNVPDVTANEATRFGQEPERPLQTGMHHPAWGLRFGSSQKIKSGTYRQHHCLNAIFVGQYPFLLFRTTQSYEQPPCARIRDLLNDFLILFRRQCPKRR